MAEDTFIPTQKLSDIDAKSDRCFLVIKTNCDYSRALRNGSGVVFNVDGEEIIYLHLTPEYARWLRSNIEKVESDRPDLFDEHTRV